MRLTPREILPRDAGSGLFVGRIWVHSARPGPRPCILRNMELVDLSAVAPTVSDLLELTDLAERLSHARGPSLGSLEAALQTGALLAPCDLQAVKACGVTFIASLLERVLEERTGGETAALEAHRRALEEDIGESLEGLVPGSGPARALKETLQENNAWSQYLEVAIGPDPEVFTKCQPMSAVGCGARVGMHPKSDWTVSEPEVVLAVDSRQRIVGASLGNDVTLRDFEGRSALLLGQAKDSTASCAIGPFIRLFDDGFGLDDVRAAEVEIEVIGDDGFEGRGVSTMRAISRDPKDLVAAAAGPYHRYPDGMMLFLGTMFVPVSDRSGPGSGFTHRSGDRVRIASEQLGALINEVIPTDRVSPWTFGFRALHRALVPNAGAS